MPWVRIEDGMPDHPKIAGLPDNAFRLHLTAICWSARQLTDGFISDTVVAKLSQSRTPQRVADRLTAAGLWESVDNGWRIHDYLRYQPSRAKVLAERDAAATRKERWKERKRNGNATRPPYPPPKGGGSAPPSGGSPPEEMLPMTDSARRAGELREELR